MASAATPEDFSFDSTGVIASVLRRCASRALDARDSALIVIHARSGAACTIPTPLVTTTGSAGADGCCWASAGAAKSTAMQNEKFKMQTLGVIRRFELFGIFATLCILHFEFCISPYSSTITRCPDPGRWPASPLLI